MTHEKVAGRYLQLFLLGPSHRKQTVGVPVSLATCFDFDESEGFASERALATLPFGNQIDLPKATVPSLLKHLAVFLDQPLIDELLSQPANIRIIRDLSGLKGHRCALKDSFKNAQTAL